ncbi:MAG: hypothetical protein PHQ58_01400 [Rhodoferax sp.]|nr:hypothetical protein [Rhodoferax sp.]MDD2879066.1 hypothetical protein [Rhodoferax sp.]
MIERRRLSRLRSTLPQVKITGEDKSQALYIYSRNFRAPHPYCVSASGLGLVHGIVGLQNTAVLANDIVRGITCQLKKGLINAQDHLLGIVWKVSLLDQPQTSV